MPSLLPSLIVLGLVAVVALHMARTRTSPPEKAAERRAAARALLLATALQGIHFAEEATTDFPGLFPGLVGLPGMPFSLFAAFNLAWIAFWLASVPGVRAARSRAFFAAWFLAIAGVVNGIAHPLLAVWQGGYFPGVVSAPFLGAASLWLWNRLQKATTNGERGRAGAIP